MRVVKSVNFLPFFLLTRDISQRHKNNPKVPARIAPITPDPILSAPPVKGVSPDGPGGMIPVGRMPVAKADKLGTGPTPPVRTAGTGAGLPAARPTSGLPVAPGATVCVVNLT